MDADLIIGTPGEFTVWVDQRKVASKNGDGFPPDRTVVDAVRAAVKK